MLDYIVCKIQYRDQNYTAAFLAEDGKITELKIEPAGASSPVSCVYSGVVDSVSKNIGGAFVNLKMRTLCFLPLTRHSHVRPSSPVLVQIVKEAAGRKEPVLTQNLHLGGQYAVLSLNPAAPAFSRKLTDEQKTELRAAIRDTDCPYGILVRTNAARAKKEELTGEIGRLKAKMDELLAHFPAAKCGECLWRPEPFYIEMYRNLYTVPDRCRTDIPQAAGELAALSAAGNGAAAETAEEIYRAPAGKAFSLAEVYNLTTELDRLLQKVVWLKSGAFLVIEKTEAFVSVDVNTGKCTKGKKPEETYRTVNLEAAAEIARQMRLRNLSGMILVDFIKMSSEDHRTELLHVMRKLVRSDHIPVDVVDLTPLGIMEIVRPKMRKPLAEVLGL